MAALWEETQIMRDFLLIMGKIKNPWKTMD